MLGVGLGGVSELGRKRLEFGFGGNDAGGNKLIHMMTF